MSVVEVGTLDLCPHNSHSIDMKTVNVATLKQKLSEYLHLVEQGDDVMVTSHRRPVARLTAENRNDRSVRLPTQPMSALRGIRGVKVLNSFSAVQALMDDRGRR